MKKVRHVLGISGGKDSAALAVYMKDTYPKLDIEYYTSDTGKELQETYDLIKKLETRLGKEIIRLTAFSKSHENPFDHKLKTLGGFLPSAQFRWCTKTLKLDPFERFVGNDPVVSYVAIRGDEDREGYISKKPNIQSIFPFRRNIWSEDVIAKALHNSNIPQLIELLPAIQTKSKQEQIREILLRPIAPNYIQTTKLKNLLDAGVKEFNQLIFGFLQTTDYPLGNESYFPLINNEDVFKLPDVIKLLENSVGMPAYYNEVPIEVNGQKGTYSRSRSGCFFCFFQQRIEWVWLYEQHPDLFWKAVEYEKEGFTWAERESLLELIEPERIEKIKKEFLEKKGNKSMKNSEFFIDIFSEGEGCAACFI